MRRLLVLLVIAALVAGCTGGDDVVVETAQVREGEVVQTVAAPARIEPQSRATVTASVAGEIAEILVDDGDEVQAGDPLVRLASESLDDQIAQAEAALASTREAGQAAMGAGVDLSPALGALRGQLDTVFPPLLSALEGQVATTEASLEAALVAVAELDDASRALRADVRDALDALTNAALLDGLEDDDLLNAAAGLDLDALADDPGAAGTLATLEDARRAASDARGQLATTRGAVNEASAELAAAERDLAGQAEAADAAQAAAVQAQIDQAERALAATQGRLDDLVIVAPIGGVVELARGSTTAAGNGGFGADLNGLGDLADLGGFGGSGIGADAFAGGDTVTLAWGCC